MRPKDEPVPPYELPPADYMPPPERKGWFGRNWMWVLPVGCLLPVIVCAGLVASGVFFGFRAIRQSEPFRHGLELAQSNPEVVAALGEPIEAGTLINAQVQAAGNSVHFDLTIPLSGPKGKGQLIVIADEAQGSNQWTYRALQVTIPGRETPILLAPAEGAPAEKPAESPAATPVQTEF